MNVDEGRRKNAIRSWAAILLSMPLFWGFVTPALAEETGKTVHASRIIDGDVYIGEDNLIGEVDDIVIRRSGRAKKLTIAYGGLLGIADKLVALNFKRFEMKDEKIIIDATEEQFKKKETFDYNERNLLPDYYYRRRYGPDPQYHYNSRPMGPFPYAPPGYYKAPNMESLYDDPFEWSYSPSRYLASSVMNRRLINEEGRDIGRVNDLVINLEENTVKKIVLLSEDILGKEVHVALPYKPLGFSAYGVVYDMAVEELKEYVYPHEEE